MARPRVFVSSTFYDLRQVRADLEFFIRNLGFEPVLHERGHVAYGPDDKPEEYAYEEVQLCDVLVSIVGGRFGTAATASSRSISQKEILTALKAGKQVYIFVERSVYSEFQTYVSNKGNDTIKYRYVDNPAIYAFIEECEALPKNNPILAFDSAQELTHLLREQFAGLFQRYLQEHTRKRERAPLEDVATTARTLKELVEYLTQERKDRDQAIRDILMSNHPAFQSLRDQLNVQYRLYFTTRDELDAWLKARSYLRVEKKDWDAPDTEEWYNKTAKKLVKVRSSVFQPDGRLKVVTGKEWSPESIKVIDHPAAQGPDDIPF